MSTTPVTIGKAGLRYIDVCSGISAPTAAWKPLGWQALCYAEIENAPRAVLAHHYPDVPLRGDFTEIKGTEYGPVDLLVGGTPCQSFSIAGLRGGLADDRGNLALEYLRLADRARPRWLVWENVPGVLSSNGGRDFGAILGGMAELGYGFAYRILDAQHFGVPQRRRRVFVVGYLGDWRRAAAVLFERHGLSGHPAPRREKGQNAPTIPSRSTGGGGLGTEFDCDGGVICPDISGTLKACAGKSGAENGAELADKLVAYGGGNTRGALDVAACLVAKGQKCDFEVETFIATAIQERAVSENIDAGPRGKGWQEDCAYTLEARNKVQSVAFSIMPMNSGKDYKARETDVAQPIMAGGPVGGNQGGDFVVQSAVRRLTPRECERLQGFPDDFTLVPYRKGMMADGPRYKMLGNSMAVPVMRWIGERIAKVDALSQAERQAA